jgi:iron complex outermembrane recepter protein
VSNQQQPVAAMCAAMGAIWALTAAFAGEAQDLAATQEEGSALEEVVVTAQRREQSLQDVPVSITAFSKEQLQVNNIEEAKDYFLFTPNVSFTEDGEAGERAVGISMRGVSDFANALTDVGGLSNSFGIYVDELNLANTANKTANPQLQDLERIEVLRGPQGTYFGRNATGGALNLSTTLPNDKLAYELGAGYASYDTKKADVVLNVPISDSFFVRLVGGYEESDNFIKNLSASGNDASYVHYNGRVAARWLVSDRFTADLSLMHTREKDGADSNVNSGVFDSDSLGATPTHVPVNADGTLDTSPQTPATRYAPFADVAPFDSGRGFYPHNDEYINKDYPESNRGKATIINARLNYQAEGWSLRSITGYIDSEHRRRFDQDVTQLALYETINAKFAETISEELRWRLQRDSWDLTIGSLYAEDSFDQVGVSPIGASGFVFLLSPTGLNPDGTLDPTAPCFCLAPGDIISGPGFDTFDSKTFAVFSDANWQINERWKATVGLRYTKDKVESVAYDGFETSWQSANNGTPPPDSAITNRGSATFDDIAPRFVLNYSPSGGINTYASVAKGYKTGGFTLDEFELPDGGTEFRANKFKQETIWNYELGAKLQILDNRLRINAAAFYMDWKNLQVPTLDANIVAGTIIYNTQILNTGAEGKGAELEIQALPTRNLLLTAGVGYLDSTFTEFGPDDPYSFENMGFELKGERLPRAPEWTLNLSGQFTLPTIGIAEPFVRLEWSYRSETTSDIEAIATQLRPLDNEVTRARGLDTAIDGTGSVNGVAVPWPRDSFPFVVPSFDVVNLRAGIRGERWTLTAYAENLLDEQYYTGTQENFSLGGIRLRPHHRVLGITFRWLSE